MVAGRREVLVNAEGASGIRARSPMGASVLGNQVSAPEFEIGVGRVKLDDHALNPR